MTPSSQYLYCVGTKPLGSHHRFTTLNCESKYMKFSVKFRMCLLEFLLKERERKNKHNFGALHACKKFPIFVLNLTIQKHCANFKERDREGKTGTTFKEQTAEWCYVKVSNQKLLFFFHRSVLMSRNIRGIWHYCSNHSIDK